MHKKRDSTPSIQQSRVLFDLTQGTIIHTTVNKPLYFPSSIFEGEGRAYDCAMAAYTRMSFVPATGNVSTRAHQSKLVLTTIQVVHYGTRIC